MISDICLYERMHHSERERHRQPGERSPRRDQAQPRSWLQPFLLLALEQWQSHGYELIRRMSAFGFETLDRGSVYRTLRQLEKDGLVVSGWDTSKEGPARRLYSLTDAGRAYLNVWAASLRGYQMMLNQFFSLYPSAAPRPRRRATDADVHGGAPGTAPAGTPRSGGTEVSDGDLRHRTTPLQPMREARTRQAGCERWSKAMEEIVWPAPDFAAAFGEAPRALRAAAAGAAGRVAGRRGEHPDRPPPRIWPRWRSS